MNNMAEEIKKSYNPFKMWGAHVGVGIVLLYYLIGFIGAGICYDAGTGERGFNICFETLGNSQQLSSDWHNNFTYRFSSMSVSDMAPGEYYQVTIIQLLLGFFVGWGIHSLIRKYKK